MLDHLVACKILGLVVERPAQEKQVVDDRVGQVADLAVKVDDHGVERVGRGFQTKPLGDLLAVLRDLGEVGVLEIFVELPLAQFVLAAWLGDVGQMGVLGQLVTEAPGDEDLNGLF